MEEAEIVELCGDLRDNPEHKNNCPYPYQIINKANKKTYLKNRLIAIQSYQIPITHDLEQK